MGRENDILILRYNVNFYAVSFYYSLKYVIIQVSVIKFPRYLIDNL